MVAATSGVLGCSTLVIAAEGSPTAPFTMTARSPLLLSSPLHLGSSSRLCYRAFNNPPSSRFSKSEPAALPPHVSISLTQSQSRRAHPRAFHQAQVDSLHWSLQLSPSPFPLMSPSHRRRYMNLGDKRNSCVYGQSFSQTQATNQNRDDMVEVDIDVCDDLVELGPKKLRDWVSMNDEEFKREAAPIAANPSPEKRLLMPENEWEDFCWRRGKFLKKSFEKVAAHYKDVDLVERLRVLRGNAKVYSGIPNAGANSIRVRSKDVAEANTKKKRSTQKFRE